MAAVVDRNAKPKMSPAEEALLNRILKMRTPQQERILRLVEMHQKATSQEEADEIGEVLAEILFGEPKHYTASKLGSDTSLKGKESLKKHRAYVGEQIRKCRQKAKMSQEKLARKAGIPQSHVCRLETGKHAPTYLTIEKLAEALGVSTSQLDPGFDD